jgi:hypothetical protein
VFTWSSFVVFNGIEEEERSNVHGSEELQDVNIRKETSDRHDQLGSVGQV